MIRVAAVAQALALRAGLRALLSASETVEVVAEAASLPELEPFLPEIDVLVLAAPRPPDSGGLGSLPAVEALPTVLLLSDDVNAARALAAQRRNTRRPWGILSMEASAEELLAAVAALHEGLIVVSPPLAGEAIDRLVGLSEGEVITQAPTETLTERERQVLQLLAQGLANKQIAASLSISEHTVKFHVSAIYAKLGAASRTEAVKRGVQQGLVVL